MNWINTDGTPAQGAHLLYVPSANALVLTGSVARFRARFGPAPEVVRVSALVQSVEKIADLGVGRRSRSSRAPSSDTRLSFNPRAGRVAVPKTIYACRPHPPVYDSDYRTWEPRRFTFAS